MAYTHSKYEIAMAPQVPGVTTSPGTAPTADNFGVVLDVTGTVAEWGPGYVPHIFRGAGLILQAGNPQTDAVHMRLRHVKGVASTATNIAHLVHPTTVTSLGRCIYYRPSFSAEIKPGELIRAVVTAAGGAGTYGQVVLYMEPRWEEPENVTEMLLTTGLPGDA